MKLICRSVVPTTLRPKVVSKAPPPSATTERTTARTTPRPKSTTTQKPKTTAVAVYRNNQQATARSIVSV